MPIIKSARKRVKTAHKATARNTKTKRALKTAVKVLQSAIKTKSSNINESLNKAQSAFDVAAKKGLMHKNKVARKKRQIAKLAKEAGAKVDKKAPKKSVTKKTPTKSIKTTSKKPAVKKSTKS